MAGELNAYTPPLARVGGYYPLRGYAMVGDSRNCALSSSDGSIDWWTVPTMASPPVFGRLLDAERGGHFVVRPQQPFEVAQSHADDAATPADFRTSSGVARVLDALVDFDDVTAQSAVVRRVLGVAGDVPMTWEVVLGDRFGMLEAPEGSNGVVHASSDDGIGWLAAGDLRLAVVTKNAGRVEVTERGFSGSFDCHEGEEALIAVVCAAQDVPTADLVVRRAQEGDRTWRDWSRGIRYDGPWQKAVRRSAIVLKQLTYEPTGALQAAATTSLPECVGGDLNYDYRFTWVRDTAFAIDAMTTIGMHAEVRAVMSCLLKEVRTTAPQVRVMYTIKGEQVDGHDDVVPGWEGYRGSKPVRVGNEAAKQLQLGVTGDLVDAVWRYMQHGNRLSSDDAELVVQIANEACKIWREKDSGIWELDDHRFYTISKVGCWTALHRAVQLAEGGHIPDQHASRWRETADEIRFYVEENCWSSSKSSYTMYAGGDDLDCGLLLMARTGYCDSDRSRLSSTVDAIRRELSAGEPLLYRYSGVEGDEGAFVACSFWLVETLGYLDRVDEAREVMDGMMTLANDAGLYSEQIDPRTFEFLGNMPQALSHLALIGAAASIARAEQR